MLEKALDTGINMSTAMMSFNVMETLIDDPMYGAKAGDYFLLPDPDTFKIVPYLEKTARMFCDLVDYNGKPWQGCTRTALKKAVEKAENMNIKFIVSFEVEGMLVRKMEGEYQPADFSKCFTPDGLEIQENIIREVVSSLEFMDIPVDKVTAEYAPGQYEVNIQPSNPVKSADDFITYKETWRAIARKNGLIATFMPKPFEEYAGNGVHFHISAFDDNDNNLFEDKNDKRKLGLSDLCYQFIGGILDHSPALAAITAPTVNSYKRILPGSWSPAFICYGIGNRDVLVRIPDGPRTKRIEFRVADGTCNPYLALASVIISGLDGIKRKKDPGEPINKEIGHLKPKEIKKTGLKWLPRSLEEAIKELKNDDYIINELGSILMEEFIRVRESELEAFRKVVTEWERKIYIETY